MSYSQSQETISLRNLVAPSLCTLFILAALYCSLCVSLRYRWLKQMQSRHGYSNRASIASMNNMQAQEIVKGVYYHEFPTFYYLGLLFAIFRLRTPL